MIEKIMGLFKAHLKAIHDIELYPYQLEISRKIFEALIQNLRLTNSATEEDIKKLKLEELAVEISRQAGKTTDVVHTIEFILVYLTKAFERPIRIGIFAPQTEQAKTDFDRLKAALNKTTGFQVLHDKDEVSKAKEESNAKTIVLPNGSSCYVFPVTATSKPESKTLDLIIFEESQDINDRILKEQIWPMGASTNAPRIYIGTAGTQICHFYRLGQKREALKLYFEDIVKQRREVYKSTGDARHLIYEQTVRQEIELADLESDEIQRPYFGKWLIGTGQFITQDALDLLETERRPVQIDKQSDCYAGIDTAKNPDSTVVTIVRDTGKIVEYKMEDGTKRMARQKELLDWLELRGDNYQDQFDIITGFDSSTGKMTNGGFLNNYKVLAVSIDSTGQGDFMPDMFEKHTKWQDENTGLYRVKFSLTSKDVMFKNLKVVICNLLTTLPKLVNKKGEKFKAQLLDLQQKYKAGYLSVHHPDEPDAHDDYPDSWALAEWAFAKYNENRISLAVVGGEPERKVDKNSEGKVTDYWPDSNWE